MIRHILLFKFNEGVGEEQRVEVVDRLHQLGDVCPTIADWSIGVNQADSPSAYDVIEVGDFKSKEDLDAYKLHPAHTDFSDFVRPLATWALADYEIEKIPEIQYLEKAKEILPVTLLLRGATYNYNDRGNLQYIELRDRLQEVVGNRLSKNQLGRLTVALVKGKVPSSVFTHIPGKGITYNAALQEDEDIRRFRSTVSSVKAERLLLLFHQLVTPK